MGIQHVVSATDLSALTLQKLFWRANNLNKKDTYTQLSGKVVALMFSEPSTRTLLSFNAAVQRLGGRTMVTTDAKSFSSEAKGESPEDTMRVISGYADCIILRDTEEGAAARAAKASLVPVINAGDGSNEHPTQAYLDLFTIWKAQREGRLNDTLRIVFHGDNRHSRTVRSLALLLAEYGKELRITITSVVFSGVPFYRDPPPDIISACMRNGIDIETDVGVLGKDADVVYVTRPQIERHGNAVVGSAKFIVTPEEVSALPEKAIIMHPLPRIHEIPTSVDADPRAYYFQQAQNGLYVRMALLEHILCH